LSGYLISIYPTAPKFPRWSNLSSTDEAEIQRLSTSPSFLRLADSILLSLDRDTLAELLASYLYFRSKGRTNGDFVLFVITKKLGKGVTIAMNVILALIPGLLFDKAFRSVIFTMVVRSMGRGKGPPKPVRPHDD